MKVLLLGAGASTAYSASKSGLRMPIARNFLETFGLSSLSEERWVLTGNLLTYLRDYHAIPVENAYKAGLDIEAVHSEVEDKLLTALSDIRLVRSNELKIVEFHAVYTQLIFMFSALINLVQNGPVSKAHCNLVKSLVCNDVVLTFNWDTLMDRALFETTDWNTDTGYGFNPHMIYRNEWIVPNSTLTNNGPTVLKLHGSSNWLTSYLNVDFEKRELGLIQTGPSDRVYVYESTLDPYPTFQGRWMPGYNRFSYGYYPPNIPDDPGISAPEGFLFVRIQPKFPWTPQSHLPSDGIESSPLIIPPVKRKTYDMFGGLFNNIWTRAEDALKYAEVIALIGYSFPVTDRHSRDLFVRAFCGRQSLPYITLVDPSPRRAFDFIHHECGIPISHIKVFEGDEGYFSESFEVTNLW